MRRRSEFRGKYIFAAVAIAAFGSTAAHRDAAWGQAPTKPQVQAPAQPPAQQQQPAQTPAVLPVKAKPYKAIAITLPVPSKDASFEAFRKQLAEVAQRKDRAALTKMIVSKGFFWERPEGDKADKKKSGIANLTAAMGLAVRDDTDTGWDTIAIYAADATVFPMPDHKDVICGPADPDFNDTDFQALVDSSQTDVSDWIYPLSAGLELRAAPRADAAVVEKVGLTFLRVLPFDGPTDNSPSAAEFVRVLTPSGKLGFVKVDSIASLGVGQLCYIKEADGWKVAGVIGGIEE